MRKTLRWGAPVLGALVGAVAPASAPAATFTHYGPPNAAAWSLVGHSVSGGAGTLPERVPEPEAVGPARRRLLHGIQVRSAERADDERTAGDREQRRTSAASTGFDPGAAARAVPVAPQRQADSSACQAKGAIWGFWTNAATNNNYCAYWCGVRHDYSTGQAIGTRPWSNGYGAGAKLVMSAFRHVQTYAGNIGWLYICAMLHDTTTSQRLEYCLRVWRSWSGPAYDAPIVFLDPHIGARRRLRGVVSDLTAAGTPYAQSWGGATTVLGTQPSGNTYRRRDHACHLVKAVNAANVQIKAANLGTCLGLLTRVRCYSTDPDEYALFGVEDGLEFLGSGTAHLGGYSSGLIVYTDY